MTWLSRFATAAVQWQHTRLKLDYDRQADKLQTALHQRDAAVERNRGHIRAAYQTAESITALVEAYNQLEQALEMACAERDQAKAELLEASPKDDLSEDFHSAKRCGGDGPECPGCVIDGLKNEVTEATFKRHRTAMDLGRARVENEDLERELRRLRQHTDRCEQYQAVVADDKAKAVENA